MPKSCSTVCPRPKSCDAPRALMSVAPNLCCDETKNRGTYTRVTGSHRVQHSCSDLAGKHVVKSYFVLLSVITLSHTPPLHKQVQGLSFRGLGKFAEQTTEAVLKLFHPLKGSSPVSQKECSSEELWACYKCEPRRPTRSLESESLWVRPREIL